MYVFIVTFIRETFQVTAASLIRIISGRPANAVERELTNLLRQFLQKAIAHSHLMNPGAL